MTEREKLIIEFYGDGRINIILKIILKILKEKKNEYKYNRKLDTIRDNTIYDNSNNSVRFNEMYKILNNKEIKND